MICRFNRNICQLVNLLKINKLSSGYGWRLEDMEDMVDMVDIL